LASVLVSWTLVPDERASGSVRQTRYGRFAVTTGHLGHSRKIALRTLLCMVEGQAVSALIEQAMDAFGVRARSARQAIADLEWDSYVEWQSVSRQNRRQTQS
jgi:hypothetical protein